MRELAEKEKQRLWIDTGCLDRIMACGAPVYNALCENFDLCITDVILYEFVMKGNGVEPALGIQIAREGLWDLEKHLEEIIPGKDKVKIRLLADPENPAHIENTMIGEQLLHGKAHAPNDGELSIDIMSGEDIVVSDDKKFGRRFVPSAGQRVMDTQELLNVLLEEALIRPEVYWAFAEEDLNRDGGPVYDPRRWRTLTQARDTHGRARAAKGLIDDGDTPQPMSDGSGSTPGAMVVNVSAQGANGQGAGEASRGAAAPGEFTERLGEEEKAGQGRTSPP